MSLIETIKADQLAARKARLATKASLLTTLLGEALTVGKNDGNRETTDAEVIAVIRKFLKGVRENLGIAGDRRDSDWCDRLDAEQEILEAYLPKQMSQEEIKASLQNACGLGTDNKGALMKYLKDNHAGQYDGKVAAKVVDEFLNP